MAIPIIKRLSIKNTNGWVQLHDKSLIVDLQFQAATANQVNIRQGTSGSGALLTQSAFELRGVDISEFYISTASGLSQGFVVIANPR